MKRLTSTLFFTIITQRYGCKLNDIREAFEEYAELVVAVGDSREGFKNKYRILKYTKISLLALSEMEDDPTVLSYSVQAIALLDIEIELLQLIDSSYCANNDISKGNFTWTGKIVDLVEVIYALCEYGSINGGDVKLKELFEYIGLMFNIEIKDFSSLYSSIKHRKADSRTYFLERLSKQLNQRLDREDES